MKTDKTNIKRGLRIRQVFAFCLLPFAFYLILPFASCAQTNITPPTNAPLPPGDYYNNSLIHLTPGFSAAPTTGQHLHLYITGSATPSPDQNSVMTTVVKVPGITDPSQLVTLNPAYMIQGITYLDGLGRPLQSVQVAGSPKGKDLIQPIAYDALGREVNKYLPYTDVAGLTDGSYRTDATAATGVFNFYHPAGGLSPQQANGIVNTQYPLGQTRWEESPLDRVVEQGAPGDSWQLSTSGVSGAGHTVRMDYGSNDANDPSIAIWVINSGGNGAATTANYGLGKLFISKTTDENGNNTYVFKDMDGRIVYKKFANGTFINYIYDDIGNLRYVIPPLPGLDGGNPAVNMPTSFTETDDVFKNFFYGYHYDSRLRQTEKKVPGKDWEYTVYNTLDQPILTQDANQKAKGIWMMVKYDAQGRVAMTGEYTSSSDRATLQGLANGSTTYLWEWFYNGPTNYGYTHVTFPDIVVSSKVLTATYFDDYSVIGNTSINPSATNFPAPSVSVDTLMQMPTGLPVATLVNVLGTTNYLFAVTHYDTFGRPVNVISQNYVGGSPSATKYDSEQTTYSFTSVPVSTVRNNYVSGLQLTINNWTRFDHMNRPLATQQQTGGGTVTTISKMEYNEIGQSITKHLGSVASGAIPASSTFLQHVNLRYNERGWLSTINDPTNLNEPNYAGVFDVFAERLDYDKNNNAYTGISQTSFNGNITSVAWQTKTPGAISGFTQERKGYIFQYDPVNQMINSTSRADVTSPWVYNENATYDNLGNILSLTRQDNGSPLNNLTYNYTATGNIRGNRLLSVSDAGTEGQSSIYTYDTNGSVVTDSKKSITAAAPIVYNELSLPALVTFTPAGKTLAYAYDATGKKLARTTATGGVTSEIRVYDDGIEYTGAAGTTLDFVHTAEGRAVKSGSAYNYQYQIADHLGNVRALFADANSNGILTADEIIQFTDYYPFGREISYPSLSLTPANNYKYNGKELQQDLSEYDYGARFYDPIIARWNVVDLMAEVNRRFSPYNYASNNPVNRIDPDGMIDNSLLIPLSDRVDADYQQRRDEKERKSNELAAGTAARLGLGWNGGGASGCCGGGGNGNAAKTDAVKTVSKVPKILPKKGRPPVAPLTPTNQGVIRSWPPPPEVNYQDFGLPTTSLAIVSPIKYIPPVVAPELALLDAAEFSEVTFSEVAFFSGRGAEEAAIDAGFTTLGMTTEGAELSALTQGMEYAPGTKAFEMWSNLSAKFASSIPEGTTVNVFLNNPGVKSIWLTVEKPILDARGIRYIITAIGH